MFGQSTAIESGFLSRSHRPVGPLACPARFERATYALEEFVAAGMCIYFNSLQRKNATVQQTVQWVLLGYPYFALSATHHSGSNRISLRPFFERTTKH